MQLSVSYYRHAKSNQHCLKHACPKSADTDQATQSDARGHLVRAWLITCCKHAVSDMNVTVSSWHAIGACLVAHHSRRYKAPKLLPWRLPVPSVPKSRAICGICQGLSVTA